MDAAEAEEEVLSWLCDLDPDQAIATQLSFDGNAAVLITEVKETRVSGFKVLIEVFIRDIKDTIIFLLKANFLR